MNIRLFTVAIVVFLFRISSIFPQDFDDIQLAHVGTKDISVSEFLERFEFSPGLRTNNKSGIESAKLEFLYTLIAEKLWAEESSLQGMDTLDVIKFSRNEFEKMFARDVLFKKEVLDKVRINPEELLEGYYRNKTTLNINFIFSEYENEIRNIYSLLNSGIEFDSILTTRQEYEEQKNPVEVIYGQMDESIEDSLYLLKVGEYTRPILTPDGWYIFRLTDKSTAILSPGETIDDSRTAAEKIIRARKSKELYFQYYQNFFSDKKIDVNPVLFEKLAMKISERFQWQKITYRIEENKLFHLLAEDVTVIENEIGTDSLNLVFIEFENNPLTLKQYFRILVFDGFSSDKCDKASIRELLDTKTRQIIEHELLAREGIKKGYHLLPDVQNGINMWVDNYLFQVLKNRFLDSVSVSEDEIYSYYNRKNKEEKYPVLYNIREILTDSLTKADIILQEIKKGKDFSELAKEYTLREWAKEQSGEFGFFPSSQFGEIGRIAATMEVGDVYGPLQVPEGYSIFKLLDKRDSVTISPVPFEKVREEYKKELRNVKANEKIVNYTATLAIKLGVGIDFNIFNSIEVTNINSLAIRRLGFGGQITAVPILAPNIDWVRPWIEKINVIQ